MDKKTNCMKKECKRIRAENKTFKNIKKYDKETIKSLNESLKEITNKYVDLKEYLYSIYEYFEDVFEFVHTQKDYKQQDIKNFEKILDHVFYEINLKYYENQTLKNESIERVRKTHEIIGIMFTDSVLNERQKND